MEYINGFECFINRKVTATTKQLINLRSNRTKKRNAF